MGSKILLFLIFTIGIGNAQTDNWVTVTPPLDRKLSFEEFTVLKPDNNKYLYAGTMWSGAFRSSDYGLSWKPVLNEPVVKNIAFAGNDLVIMTSLHDVFLLTNNCKTVETVSQNGLEDTGTTSLLSTRDGVIFIGFYSKSVLKPSPSGGSISEYQGGGLWRSTDLGKSWERVLLDSTVKTTDNGKTWLKYRPYRQKYIPTSQPNLTINSMGISPDGAILVDADVDFRHGVFRSSDNGMTWTKIQELDIFEDGRTNLVKTSEGEIFTGYGLLFSGISRSADGGNTFNDVVNGLPSGDINDLIAIPGGDVLCTTSNGIYYLPFKGNNWSCVAFKGEEVSRIIWYGEYIFASVNYKDGENESGIYRIPLINLKEKFPENVSEANIWKEIDKPFSSDLRLFEIDKSGAYWAADESKNLKHSIDQGKRWDTMSLPDELIHELIVDNKNKTVWISTSEGLFLSTSLGENWKKIDLPALPDQDPYDFLFLGTVYLDDNGNILVGASKSFGFSKGYLFIGKEGGNKWQLMKTELPGIPSYLFRSKSGRLFCGVSGAGLYYSTDNGAEWSDCNKGLLRSGEVYLCNYGADADRSVGSVNILEDGTIYVVRGAMGIAKTSDEGVNWAYLQAPGEYVWDVYVSPKRTIYAATDMGIFKTENEGKDWKSFSAGLFSSSISSLIKDKDGHLIAVARDGRIYKTIDKIDLSN